MDQALLNVVLIAKKNTSLSLRSALQSVIDQTYKTIEILVVDANEPNSMYSLGLQEDLADFPEVRYLQMDQSLSIPQIRNYCINMLEGEYITFLSCYDKWDSLYTPLQMDRLIRDTQGGASCCNGILVDERKMGTSVKPLSGSITYASSGWVLTPPAPAQVIYRSCVVKELGGFDERFEIYCDADMLLRINRLHQVFMVPVSLCECHITSDDEEYDEKRFRDGKKILDKYRDHFLKNRDLTLDYYRQMLQLSISNYLWLDCFAYLVMFILTAPGYSFGLGISKAGKLVRYVMKLMYRDISMIKSYLMIWYDIRQMKRGKPVKISNVKNRNSAEKKLVQEVVIPKQVTVIKACMFYDCDRLVSVSIPNTVTEIQAHAFQNCKRLRQITFEEGSRLTKIGAYAFAGCRALEMLSLPTSLLQIGKFAFFECVALQQLLFTHQRRGKVITNTVFPDALLSIPRYAFAGCCNLVGMEADANSMLEIVDQGAFLCCSGIIKLLFTGRLDHIGKYAFAHCNKVETIAITQIDSLKSIGKCAFMNCESLTYFQVPNQLERIHIRTFYGCSGIRTIRIPKRVLSINHQAFAKCAALEKAIILTGDTIISPTAFDRHTRLEILDGREKDISTGV